MEKKKNNGEIGVIAFLIIFIIIMGGILLFKMYAGVEIKESANKTSTEKRETVFNNYASADTAANVFAKALQENNLDKAKTMYLQELQSKLVDEEVDYKNEIISLSEFNAIECTDEEKQSEIEKLQTKYEITITTNIDKMFKVESKITSDVGDEILNIMVARINYNYYILSYE